MTAEVRDPDQVIADARREQFRALTDDELLALLDHQRRKFTHSDEELMREMATELVLREVYPRHWPGPTVFERVRCWGAHWHVYRPPFNCQYCGADLCDRKWGPPGKREIGQSNGDRVVAWHCPDCGKSWPR